MKTTVAKAIVKFLERAGVEIAAGCNGHGNWAFLDALQHESRIRGVQTTCEDAAVHLADGYWRMRRKPPPAVVFTTVGPGNLNICPALANAFYESSAMLVIAGAGPSQWFDKGSFEECYRYGPEEFIQVVKPICKKAALATRPDTALEIVVRAYKEAITGRPGPTLVQIPFDIQHTEIEIPSIPDPLGWTRVFPAGPDPAALEKIAELLARCRRPLLLAGSGLHNALGHEALRTFVEEFGVPVGTTFSGMGAIDGEHPLCVGAIDPSGTGHGWQAARECDLLVALGARFHDFNTLAWNLYRIPQKTKLVHVDVDPIELSRNYPAELGLAADARLALEGLIEVLRESKLPRNRYVPWTKRIGRWRKDWERQVRPLTTSDAAPVSNARLLRDLSEAVAETDPEASVLFDTGNLLLFAPAFFTPRSRFVATNNGHMARMGWSLGAAIGAALGNPGHPAVAVVGDGSFLMAGLAVATAHLYRVPATWIVLNNRTLGIEREAMEVLYGRSAFCDLKIEATGAPWSPDYVKIAQGLGIEATKISRPRDFKPAVRGALESGKPWVFEVETNPAEPGYRNAILPIPIRWDQPAVMDPDQWLKSVLPAGSP